MTDKIYGVTIRQADGVAVICFCATLEKARLRSLIHRAQGFTASRPAFMPRMTRAIADIRSRGQIVAPSLRND